MTSAASVFSTVRMERPYRRLLAWARRWRQVRFSVATVLVGGFSSLTLLAVMSVLALGVSSATTNTMALLDDKADLILTEVETVVRHQLEPPAGIVRWLSRHIESGDIPLEEPRLTDAMRGALAGVPDATAVLFIRPDFTAVRVARVESEAGQIDLLGAHHLTTPPPDGKPPFGPETLVWSEPVWSPWDKAPVLFVGHTVWRGDTYLGAIAVSVSLGEISRFLGQMSLESDLAAFVLYDRNYVLAHPALLQREPVRTEKGALPLPRLDEIGDPYLARLWTAAHPIERTPRLSLERYTLLNLDRHVFLLRPLEGFGNQPLMLGIAFSENEVDAEILIILRTAGLGVVILIVSVALAIGLGKRISRQIARFAAAADSVSALRFDTVEELPESRISELARAGTAFNSMIAGLRWFETYVPKALVLRLMRQRGTDLCLVSEERMVTVMFTDIRGFSGMAQNMSASETAALLNHHFTRLASCIEAEGGTVDKFIGDAIMAFWGAPEVLEDHASRAVRAAAAIVEAMRKDNDVRTATGLAPVRMRIGIHTGPVIVGNIGSESRINYTIVGDTVNVASRIEALAGDLQGSEDVIVLTSGTTAEEAAGSVSLTPVGEHVLRGLSGNAEIWRLF